MSNTDQVLVADVTVGERFRKELGDINAFAANLDEVGLLQPIGITATNELIFGQRRLEAARQLGWEWIPARVIDIGSLLMGEWSENEFRKELIPSERVAIGKAVEAWLKDRHGSNQHVQKGPDKPACFAGQSSVQIFAPPPKGQKTREIAAEAAGFDNQETYRQAKKVVAIGTPELVEAMDLGHVSIADAAAVADKPEAVQRKAVKTVDNGKAKTARQTAEPKLTGKPGMVGQMEVLMGKFIRLIDDAVRGDKVPDRYAEVVKKNADQTLKAVMTWKKNL